MATKIMTLTHWHSGNAGIELGKQYVVDTARQEFTDTRGITRQTRWGEWEEVPAPKQSKPESNNGLLPASGSKYHRVIRNVSGEQIKVDVYDVLKAFNVTCPALQHLLKKALNAGLRGHKDLAVDLQDIIDSAIRAKQLHNV